MDKERVLAKRITPRKKVNAKRRIVKSLLCSSSSATTPVDQDTIKLTTRIIVTANLLDIFPTPSIMLVDSELNQFRYSTKVS